MRKDAWASPSSKKRSNIDRILPSTRIITALVVLLTPLIILAVIGAGAVAGCLGALLGIGGGVFLVPFLNVGLGLPFNIAAGIGLMPVIATSSVVSAGSAGRGLINLRVGMLLQVFAGAGGLIGGETVVYMPRTWLYVIFSAVTALIALVMLKRLDVRN